MTTTIIMGEGYTVPPLEDLAFAYWRASLMLHPETEIPEMRHECIEFLRAQAKYCPYEAIAVRCQGALARYDQPI